MPYLYNPENMRPVLAVRLTTDQMGRIDAARHQLRVSRSDLARRALNEMLDRMQVEQAA